MACFIVPAAEAVVTTIASKIIRSNEQKNEDNYVSEGKIKFSEKLGWLSKLLYGGSALLAFEHLWHGEIVPWFPFLTAAADPDEAAAMLHEMGTAGTSMALLITAVWAVMLIAAKAAERKISNLSPKEELQ